MPKKLIVHVGPAKTGTSAIQFALANAEPGPFLYPRVGRWSDAAHHNMTHSLFPALARPESRVLTPIELAQQLRAEGVATDKDILISTESLSAGMVARFVEFMKDALAGLVHDVQFVVVLRSHVERIASLYNQAIKDAYIGETRSPDEFLAVAAHGSLYWSLVQSIVTAGHKVTIVNYHGEGLVSRFVRELGGDSTLLPAEERRNISLGRVGLVALLEVNRSKALEDRPRYFNSLRRIRRLFSGGFIPFSEDAIARVDSLFSRDLERVTRFTGASFSLASNMKHAELIIYPEELQEIIEALRADGIYDAGLFRVLSNWTVC